MVATDYNNVETKMVGGTKIVRKVSIKNGKGQKSMIKYKNGKKIHSVKKPISDEDTKKIKQGIFIVGLFDDCKKCNKTRKRR
jgi:predicted RNase H-related nuclease YkuK (DUF458 family)